MPDSAYRIRRNSITFLTSYFLVTPLVAIYVTPVLARLVTHSSMRIWLEPPGAFLWCGLYFIWFGVICLPATVLVDRVRLNGRKVKTWFYPLVVISLFLAALVFWEALSWIGLGRLTITAEIIIYAIESTILGAAYVGIYLASGRLLGSGQMDHQKHDAA